MTRIEWMYTDFNYSIKSLPDGRIFCCAPGNPDSHREHRNCSIEIRTMNGARPDNTVERASQQRFNQGETVGNTLKTNNLKSEIRNLKFTVLPYFCPRLIYGRINPNFEACGYKIF